MKRCPQCGKQYSTEANFCPIDAGRLEEVPDDAPAEPDDQILGGRFAIGDHLGDGGMTGQVFEGTDNQTGERCVIKWVDREVFASPLQMQRTERELKQLERATAAQIARVLGHGRKSDRLWFASEHFEGTSLRDIVAESGPLPAERAAALVYAVGTGLTEAAKLGVIHRDVAPKNVLVGEGDAVKIINFGVAVPATPSVRGVPEYVAPEQVDGKPVDQRSNIYSLGAMYFFLVTGRPPFEGDVSAVHSAHLHTPPPKASDHAEVPEAVDRLIDRALAKQSSKRYMTLRQLLGELEKLAGVEPVRTARLGGGLAKREQSRAAQTMLGVGALSAEGYTRSPEANPAAALADLAPPVEGRVMRDHSSKINTGSVVTSEDAAAASGQIGEAGEADEASDVAAIGEVLPQPTSKNGESARPIVEDDRPRSVAGEIGDDDPDDDLEDDEPEDDDDDDDGGDDDDFDMRATQPSQAAKRKKRRRRRKKRKTRRPVDQVPDTEPASAGDVDRGRELAAVSPIERTAEPALSEKELVEEMGSRRLLIAGGVIAVVIVIAVIAILATG